MHGAAWGLLLGGSALLLGAAAIHAIRFQRWYIRETRGAAYFARPLAERRALKQEIGRRVRFLLPAARVLGRLGLAPAPRSIELRGVRGPAVNCTRATFEAASRYQPDAGDVFVATQMKCGTTWMQQVVYEVLSRGRGNLEDDGHRHLYALSPWIEARQSVTLEDAPRVGVRAQRIIKTHLPASLCPWSESARFVYVTRHPVACFASCVDFIRMLAGPLTPPLPDLLDWFCSDQMWWSPWPVHVEGWWRRAEERSNVLFVHYEEMLQDLPGVVDRVAAFLETPLDAEERHAVVDRSRFDYMKAREELFEMAPPTPFSVGGGFFRSGSRERHADVGPGERERILAFCRERLRGARYPAARFYPELAE
jgi:hypothetical protein